MQDCGDVMRLLLASQTGQELADDDPQVCRLCVCALCCLFLICYDIEHPIFSDFLTCIKMLLCGFKKVIIFRQR